VRWTKLVKKQGGLLQRGVENSREVGEQRHAQDVQTHVSKVKTNPTCLCQFSAPSNEVNFLYASNNWRPLAF